MTEIISETEIRARNVVTIPSIIRDILNIASGDRIRWERNDSGDVCICKVISHKVNNKFNGGKKVEDKEGSVA